MVNFSLSMFSCLREREGIYNPLNDCYTLMDTRNDVCFDA
jgi:hypothetical protein